MKTTDAGIFLHRNIVATLTRALVVAGFFIGVLSGHAQMPPGFGNYGPTNVPIESWSFYYDHTNWTDCPSN